MHRRHFLQSVAAAGLGLLAAPRGLADTGTVMTVSGPVPPRQLGVTLPHEHVLVDFAGADEVHPRRYDREEVFEVALPHLQRFYDLGGRTLVECTPAYLARDPLLLRRLSQASGLHLLTSTGYYGAREDQHLPAHTFSDSVDELAGRWIQEWRDGIDDTGVRPGFIKIGVDGGPLSDIDQKLIRSAARMHRTTGLTIAAHTGPAVPAFEQLDVLREEGVDPSAWIWVHAQGEEDSECHLKAARRGAWVEFDGVHPDRIDQHVALVVNMQKAGLLNHVLVSQDAGWYNVGEERGGTYRGYDALTTRFVPALQEAGLTNDELHRLLVTNPAQAFTVRPRLRRR